jgi:site-specific recombinase XerD
MFISDLFNARSGYYDMKKAAGGRWIMLPIFSLNHWERTLWGQPTPSRLLDQVSIVCRRRHLSPRTEDSYRFWIRQYIHFNDRRHPNTLAGAEVEAFLNHPAAERRVAPSTQTQALNALVFLYDLVLQKPLGDLAGLKRVQRRHRVPVVLTREEVKAVLEHMPGFHA